MIKRFQGVKMKRGVNTKEILTTNYKSLGALLKFLEQNEQIMTNEYSSHNGTHTFTGTSNMGEALKMLKDGNDEIKAGLKKNVKIAMDKLQKELNSQPESYIADIEGLFFDVAKVIEGEPECWYREPWDKTKKPRLQIPIMGSYNGGFKKEKAIKNASEIIALVKALEDNGFECELSMIFMAENCTWKHEKMFHSIMIKNYDESFNWNKLSAMLHPSFFRRIIFRDKELLAPKNLSDGYGSTANPSNYFENGDSMLVISEHSSIERFKNQVLYRLSGK